MSTFPSDERIYIILSLAKGCAKLLLEFTGMQETRDGQLVLPIPTQVNLDESEPLDLFQVALRESSTTAHHIGIDGEINEAVKESAAIVGQSHDLDSQLEDLGLDDNMIEADYVAAGRKYLQQMKASDSTVQASTNQVDLTYNASQYFDYLEGKLNYVLLSNLWVENDSQVGRKKGNERRKKQLPENNPPAPDTNAIPDGNDPSTCSKIFALIVKSTEGLEKVVARIHGWNVRVPLSMHCLKINATSNLSIPTQTMFNEGLVSQTNPHEPGKFVFVIKKKVCLFPNFMITHSIDDCFFVLEYVHWEYSRGLCVQERTS